MAVQSPLHTGKFVTTLGTKFPPIVKSKARECVRSVEEEPRELTRIDGNALTRYCQLWSRWKKAELFIQKHGDTYPLKDESGKIKCLQQFPQVSIAHKLAALLTRLEQEFGLTPSARSRISLPAGTIVPTPAQLAKQRFFKPPLVG